MSETHLLLPATNDTLIGYLARLGWTPETFAYHLNALARSMQLPVPEMHPRRPGAGSPPAHPAPGPAHPASPGQG